MVDAQEEAWSSYVRFLLIIKAKQRCGNNDHLGNVPLPTWRRGCTPGQKTREVGEVSVKAGLHLTCRMKLGFIMRQSRKEKNRSGSRIEGANLHQIDLQKGELMGLDLSFAHMSDILQFGNKEGDPGRFSASSVKLILKTIFFGRGGAACRSLT